MQIRKENRIQYNYQVDAEGKVLQRAGSVPNTEIRSLLQSVFSLFFAINTYKGAVRTFDIQVVGDGENFAVIYPKSIELPLIYSHEQIALCVSCEATTREVFYSIPVSEAYGENNYIYTSAPALKSLVLTTYADIGKGKFYDISATHIQECFGRGINANENVMLLKIQDLSGVAEEMFATVKALGLCIAVYGVNIKSYTVDITNKTIYANLNRVNNVLLNKDVFAHVSRRLQGYRVQIYNTEDKRMVLELCKLKKDV